MKDKNFGVQTSKYRGSVGLTRSEWEQFFGAEDYRATCPDLPMPIGDSSEK
jgi:hypothetical protein